MGCFARPLAALLLAAPLSVGFARADAAGPDLAALLAEAIAARWGVDPRVIALDWDADRAPAGVRSFRLAGSGADGAWLVTLEGDSATRALVVRAGISGTEPIAARDLERGVILETADIRHRPSVRWGPPVRDALVAETGWETQRRIRTGEPLRPPAVELPLAVRAGDPVTVEFVRGPVLISLSGRAAGSGRIGEAVSVRTGTGRRLDGVVTAPGRVRIGTLQEAA